MARNFQKSPRPRNDFRRGTAAKTLAILRSNLAHAFIGQNALSTPPRNSPRPDTSTDRSQRTRLYSPGTWQDEFGASCHASFAWAWQSFISALLQSFQHLVERETAGLLPRWELLVGCQMVGNKGLGRN